MTGSGTQTDPYIVDSWAEFESIVTKSGVIIQFNPDAENITTGYEHDELDHEV